MATWKQICGLWFLMLIDYEAYYGFNIAYRNDLTILVVM